jgi:hypothetical protein
MLMINRNNYEEYFLLYTDNELSDTDRNAVEEFVEGNPDLRDELRMFQQLKMKPENHIVFNKKDLLRKGAEGDGRINHANYEEYFLLYLDNELDETTKGSVEKFVKDNPVRRQEFSILLQTRVEPDTNIILEDKKSLYRRPQGRVVFLGWIRMAAAVLVLFFVIGLIYDLSRKKPEIKVAALVPPASTHALTAVQENGSAHKKNTKPVTSSTIDSFNSVSSAAGNVAVNRQKKKMQGTEKTVKDSAGQLPVMTGGSAPDQGVTDEPVTAFVKSPGGVAKADEQKRPEVEVPQVVVLNTAGDPNASTQSGETMDNGSDEGQLYFANTSAKKNKFRGFFRQVSRAFTKTAHVGDENADNSKDDAVLIGSFRFALK